VAALPILRQARRDAHLVFVGPVDEASASGREVVRLAEKHGVAPAVHLAGAHDDAATLLSAFDVLLHPSRHEALPRAVLEALHAGIPVIAAAVGGLPEAIEDRRAACWFLRGTPAASAKRPAVSPGTLGSRHRSPPPGGNGRVRSSPWKS
jgi:glycosyltransferase involved in cell wall biosynthesis